MEICNLTVSIEDVFTFKSLVYYDVDLLSSRLCLHGTYLIAIYYNALVNFNLFAYIVICTTRDT